MVSLLDSKMQQLIIKTHAFIKDLFLFDSKT